MIPVCHLAILEFFPLDCCILEPLFLELLLVETLLTEYIQRFKMQENAKVIMMGLMTARLANVNNRKH